MQGILARSIRPAAVMAACAFVAIGCREAARIVDPQITPPEQVPSQEELKAIDVVYANESGLFTLKADGTQRVQLAVGDFRAVSVSPDGKRLAYTRNGIAYVSNVDGTDAREVASSTSGRPAWSPDQSRLAITRTDGAIYTVDIASLELTQVTQPDAFSWDGSAAWSPDGERIAFTRTGEDFNSIWTVGADGTHEFNIGDGEPFNSGVPSRSPVWSPDGKKIAFAVFSYGLSVMNADGTGAVYLRLPNVWGSISAVDDWSPDGKWIAFQISGTGGRVDAFLIDLESRVARLNGSESWFAVSLRKPVPPEPQVPPPAPQTVPLLIYQAPDSLYAYWNRDLIRSRYLLFDDGRISLQFLRSDGSTFEYKGKRTVVGSGFTFKFDGDSRWEATATLVDEKLEVRYNVDMAMSDFIDGTYTLVPDTP